MKIKHITALCKRQKTVYLYDGNDGQQYVGDGAAIYPLYGLPRLDEKSILTVLDVPYDKRLEYEVRRGALAVNAEDSDPEEEPIGMEYRGLVIVVDGDSIAPIKTSRGIVFIRTKYLSPIMDHRGLTFFLRTTYQQDPCIAVKEGFLLRALIMPHEMVNDEFLQKIEAFRLDCIRAQRQQELRQTARKNWIDQETGELRMEDMDSEEEAQ